MLRKSLMGLTYILPIVSFFNIKCGPRFSSLSTMSTSPSLH